MTYTSGETPVVAAPAGTFRGAALSEKSGGVDVFRGIRYAQAPTGKRRWRDPQPAVRAVGEVDATAFGAISPQLENPALQLGEGVVFDEDCLFLNVWRSRAQPVRPRPVMVWLHGGAYTLGSGSAPMYDGATLATTGDVVVVTINYRLSGFGFVDLSHLSTPEYAFDGNLALKDVMLALKWVKDNIAAFGGDPQRVTLFGESAGAGLVTTLLAVPSAEGLFHRAIAESSPVSSVYGAARARRVAELFVEQCGLVGAGAGAGVDAGTGPDAGAHADVDPDELRALPAETIRDAGAAVFAQVPALSPGTIGFAPVVDGELVPEAPLTVLSEGRGLPVPLMIGTNRDEASFFKFMKSPLMPIEPDRIRQMFVEMQTQVPSTVLPSETQVLAAYQDVQKKRRGLAIARDIGFRMPTLWAAAGHSAVAPVWLYRFDFATPLLRAARLGATHGAELRYVWGNLENGRHDLTFRLGGKRAGARVSARMLARWAAFAHGDSPQASGAPVWPRYDPRRRETLVIDTEDRIVADPDATIRAGWGAELLAFP